MFHNWNRFITGSRPLYLAILHLQLFYHSQYTLSPYLRDGIATSTRYFQPGCMGSIQTNWHRCYYHLRLRGGERSRHESDPLTRVDSIKETAETNSVRRYSSTNQRQIVTLSTTHFEKEIMSAKINATLVLSALFLRCACISAAPLLPRSTDQQNAGDGSQLTLMVSVELLCVYTMYIYIRIG